jgi:hypothetical protein
MQRTRFAVDKHAQTQPIGGSQDVAAETKASAGGGDRIIEMRHATKVERARRTLDTTSVWLKFLCSWWWAGRLGLAVLATGAATLAAAASHTEQSPCDPSLAPSANYPFKYINRGDRCEGVYMQLVGSTTLTLLSFTAAFAAFDPKAGQPVVIGWPTPAKAGGVQLRALTTRQHLYYRMDTRVNAGGSQYRWPTDVLAAMGLARADIGLLGWIHLPVGGTDQEVLLPLAVSQRNPPSIAGTDAYALLVQPAAQLSELFITVTRPAADGGGERLVQPTRELGYGYYPADNPVEIPLEAPAESGVYAVQLGAKLRGGGVATLRILIYAPGR